MKFDVMNLLPSHRRGKSNDSETSPDAFQRRLINQ